MKKLTHLFVIMALVSLLFVATGVTVNYKSAQAYYPTNNVAAFTPTGYANLTAASAASSSVALATNGASTPPATVVVVQNLGSNVAYVALGASNVVATVAGSYPVQAAQTSVLTIRNSTHMAAITSTGSSSLSIVTGY